MNFKNIILFSSVPVILAACLGGGGGAGTNLAATAGLNLPANVEVIADDASLASLAAVNMAAYNSAGTDYTNLKTEYWINAGAWQEPLQMADMLVCIMGASSHSDLFNATYQGLIDMNICQSDSGDQAAKTANFADVVMTVSRANNTANQIGAAWFTQAQDENDDGDTLDAGEVKKFASNIVISEGTSTSNPFGVFTMSWNQDNSAANEHSRGTLKVADEGVNQVGITFIEENKQVSSPAYDQTEWVRGTLNKDGSGGTIKVSHVNSGTTTIYKINFNGSYANVDKAGTASCMNLDESTMTTYIDRYNLYNNTTGALIDINAGLEFVHGAAKDKRGYAGSYFDGSGTEKHWMWVEDGSTPTTIYSATNTAVSYSVSWSSGVPTISGITFDLPIRFTDSFVGTTPAGVSDSRTENLNYEGPGQLWGIDWKILFDADDDGSCSVAETNNGCNVNKWAPDYNLADGLVLEGKNGAYAGVSYRVKRVEGYKTLATVASSNCSALPVTNSDVNYSAPSITAVTHTFSSKPTITGKPQVIHGKKMF